MYIVKENEIWKLGYISIDRFSKYGSVSMNRVLTLQDRFPLESKTTPIMTEVFDKYFGDDCDVYKKAKEYVLLYDTYFDGCEFISEAQETPESEVTQE